MTIDQGDAVLDSRSFMIEQEPFYLPQGEEVALFEAAYGEVVFGDTKEGGIVALRVNDAITVSPAPETS